MTILWIAIAAVAGAVVGAVGMFLWLSSAVGGLGR
jgi:hypothetical protein